MTKEQLAFLERHHIDVESVMDGTGMRGKSEYGPLMRRSGLFAVVNVTPCKKAGHTMRDRHGRCLQCNPASINFQRRYSQNLFLYIAGSQQAKLTKLGLAETPERRENTLNGLECYGRIRDWKVICAFRTTDAGRIESNVKRILSPFHVYLPYEKDGRIVRTEETFSCNAQDLLDTFKFINFPVKSLWKAQGVAIGDYHFGYSKTADHLRGFSSRLQSNTSIRHVTQKKKVRLTRQNRLLSQNLESYQPLAVFRLLCAVFGNAPTAAAYQKMLMALTPDKIDEVKRVIATLREEDATALMFRFGLPPDIPRVSQIGEAFLQNRFSNDQLVTDALRRLRHPTRIRRLEGIVPFETKS